MRTAFRRHAVAVVAAALTVVGGTTAGRAARVGTSATPASDTELDGTLVVAHGDTFQGAPSVMQTALRTSHGLVPIVVPGSQHARVMHPSGRSVRVRGSRRGDAFAATSLSADTRVATASTTSAPLQ